MIFYPVSGDFFLAWLLAFTKLFAWLAGTDNPLANDFVNAKSHAREKPLLQGNDLSTGWSKNI